MNHVLHEGAQYAQFGWVSGMVTVVFIAAFLYWTWYAYSKKNRARFEEAAQLPFTTGDDYE